MAAEQLRAVILRCVEARTSDLDSALLLLSGGLDSSIVAAALAACGRRTSALNMVANRIAGDERDYARLVAAHCQIDLTEKLRDTTAVDITRSGVAGRPNPCERSFTQATRAAVNDLRDVIHHDAVLHGGALEAANGPDGGAVFTLWLPVRQADEEDRDECGEDG